MVDYKTMYFKLFSAASDAIEIFTGTNYKTKEMLDVIDILTTATLETEEMYIDSEDEEE